MKRLVISVMDELYVSIDGLRELLVADLEEAPQEQTEGLEHCIERLDSLKRRGPMDDKE